MDYEVQAQVHSSANGNNRNSNGGKQHTVNGKNIQDIEMMSMAGSSTTMKPKPVSILFYMYDVFHVTWNQKVNVYTFRGSNSAILSGVQLFMKEFPSFRANSF